MSFFMLLPISLMVENAPIMPDKLAAMVGGGCRVGLCSFVVAGLFRSGCFMLGVAHAMAGQKRQQVEPPHTGPCA